MRYPLILTLASAALISSCTQQPPAPASAATDAAIGSTTDCIDQQFVVSRRPQGPNALIFEMTGGVAWRNDLASTCPGLENRTASDAYRFEVNSGRLCRNDRFQVFDPVEAQATGPKSFPSCRLGTFTRVAAE